VAPQGGGILVDQADLTLSHVVVEDCFAASAGGGISCLNGARLELLDSTVDSSAGYGGGGIYASASSLTIMRSQLSGLSIVGGAIRASGGSLTLSNSYITNNFAQFQGGGICLYDCDAQLSNVVLAGNVCPNADPSAGGHSVFAWQCEPIFTNVSILLSDEGPPYPDVAVYDATLTVVNSILWGPIARVPALFNGGTVKFSHSIVRGSGGSGANWNAAYGVDLGGNLDLDPKYLDATHNDLRLSPNSPAIDAGDATLLPPGLLFDLEGNPRRIGANVDMGAYEWQGTVPTRAMSLSELKRRFGGG
jgi:hypothetical protein